MKTTRSSHLKGQKLVIWTYVFLALVLSFQNCGPSFSSNSTTVSLDSIQGATVITAALTNNYSPNQNLSFSFDKSLVGNGPLVWSNLLNSTTSCTEVSADNADPYIVNCTGKGILAITLVVNSGTGGVIGPLTSNFVVNDGLPRSNSLVPFVITASTGNWNKIGLTPPPNVPGFLQGGGGYIIREKANVTPGSFTFSFNNNNRFLNGVIVTWGLSGGCIGSPNGNSIDVSCPALPPPVAPAVNPTSIDINISASFSGSDSVGGPFAIPSANWNGTYVYATNVLTPTFAGFPAPPAPPTPDPASANYIGPQGLLQTTVLFVGQTLRIFNKASASKQFGLNFNGMPCASTGPIPYTASGDYSRFVDCVITAEFGDPAVGSPIANAYDGSQNFYLIAIDGVKLYNNNCKLCHLDLSISRNQIGNETLDRLKQAIQGKANSQPMLLFDNSYSSHLSNLSDPQKLAIIHVLQN